MRAFLTVFLLTAGIAVCSSTTVPDAEWNSYKVLYGKVYPSTTAEQNARYYYAVNKARINTHNDGYVNRKVPFALGVNQFTDIKFVQFAAMFPVTQQIPSNGVPYTLPTAVPQATFSYGTQGFNSPVQDQGLVCNSGWAYAAATTMHIYDAVITGAMNTPALSAQNFIDCAGAARSCVNQVAQIAFDYLTQGKQRVYPITEYPNRPLDVQGMCVLPATTLNGKTLTSYSNIANGNDVALKSIVNYQAPVTVLFNPGTFEFMHYKEGVFNQPAPTQQASHYMTVVGYGTDLPSATGKNYWYLQNSFGVTWGEQGFIRIERDTTKPIANAAIFPSV